jgi:RNA polymerase sigma-70 factor (ECF subfamily)
VRESLADGSRFEEVYRVMSRDIYVFLARRTFDVEAAYDLAGETFAVAFRARRRFRGIEDRDAVAWVFGIARNLLRNYERRGRVERKALKRLGATPPPLTDDQIERLETIAGLSDVGRAVSEALLTLSERERVAVELRVLEELGYREVASRLRISEQTARARVSRGLRALQLRLEHAGITEVGD